MKIFDTLITVQKAAGLYQNSNCLIVDCSRSPLEEDDGRAEYLKHHIPGALHAHLDREMAAVPVPGVTGRHPLPKIEIFAAILSRWGLDANTQMIVYDHGDNMAASRLWWMTKWVGHKAVAVLNGGLAAWKAANLPIESGEGTARSPAKFVARPQPQMVVTAQEVADAIEKNGSPVVDARSAERFRGENEPFDPVAGHIPGSISCPYGDNLDENGLFLPKTELRNRYSEFIGREPPVFYCGSGVSACHNVLAWEYAGLGPAKLYVGSWSDWITDSQRPVATGEK